MRTASAENASVRPAGQVVAIVRPLRPIDYQRARYRNSWGAEQLRAMPVLPPPAEHTSQIVCTAFLFHSLIDGGQYTLQLQHPHSPGGTQLLVTILLLNLTFSLPF